MTDEQVVDFQGRRSLRGGGTSGDDGLVPVCPIIALGHTDAGIYHFISPSGMKREFTSRELRSDAGQASLFDGDTSYLVAAWPHPSSRWDWNAKDACIGLMAMCAAAGMWNPETPVHGRGIWRAADDRLICHCGDRLFLSGAADVAPPVGSLFGGAIYARRPAIVHLAAEPASADLARRLRQGFTFWQFKPLGTWDAPADREPSTLAADLLFDAVSLAYLGAGPRWRVHVLIKAPYGAGKSTLEKMIERALGAGCLALNNVSEAGVRNSLTNEARVLLIDEAEGDAGGVMQSIIELIRKMSGNEGNRGARGTGAGGARHFEIAGTAFMFCINPPLLEAQDLSRTLVFELDRPISAHEHSAFEAIEFAAEHSAKLRARAFHGFQRFRENLTWCRAALISCGCSPRQADTLGSVLAAGAMMSDDRPLDQSAARDLADNLTPLIEAVQAAEAENSNAMQCWQRLELHRADKWRSGENLTIAMLLREGQSDTLAGRDARRALSDYYGMRLELGPPTKGMPEAPCLYVSRQRQHSFLRGVYSDTPWREGLWGDVLGSLSSAKAVTGALRVGGIKTRCVAIPRVHLPPPERDQVGQPND